jgi:hypothetical protein
LTDVNTLYRNPAEDSISYLPEKTVETQRAQRKEKKL